MTQAPPEPRTPQPAGRRSPALAAELRTAIMRTSRRLRQERSTDDVTPGQDSVLAVLDRNGPCTPRELAAHEKVQPPSMTKIVGRLEELELVSRTPDPGDRRQVVLAITKQGRGLLADDRRRKDAWVSQRLRTLDDGERAVLTAALPVLEKLSRS
jgi:DNA-binding MarR family transcriptional regulator